MSSSGKKLIMTKKREEHTQVHVHVIRYSLLGMKQFQISALDNFF